MESNDIRKNCFMCALYEYDELYEFEYDFSSKDKQPLTPNPNGYCIAQHDLDESGNLILDFDRTTERTCCALGVFQVALLDKELQTATNKYELLEMFNKKYLHK